MSKATTYGDLYKDSLDETYDCGNYHFSDMLESHDPIAFSCGFTDFMDDPSRFQCDTCDKELTYEDTDGAEEDDCPTCKKCLAGDDAEEEEEEEEKKDDTP